MHIAEDVAVDNLKEKARRFRALGNPLHLRILLCLEKVPKTSTQIHEALHGAYVHRENTYQALEKLVRTRILKKGYDSDRKKFFYSLP